MSLSNETLDCFWLNNVLLCLFDPDIYHTTFDWPPNTDVQNRLKEVEGFTEDDMINKLVVYHRHFEGIADCYKKSSKIINADQPKADVFQQGKAIRL